MIQKLNKARVPSVADEMRLMRRKIKRFHVVLYVEAAFIIVMLLLIWWRLLIK